MVRAWLFATTDLTILSFIKFLGIFSTILLKFLRIIELKSINILRNYFILDLWKFIRIAHLNLVRIWRDFYLKFVGIFRNFQWCSLTEFLVIGITFYWKFIFKRVQVSQNANELWRTIAIISNIKTFLTSKFHKSEKISENLSKNMMYYFGLVDDVCFDSSSDLDLGISKNRLFQTIGYRFG